VDFDRPIDDIPFEGLGEIRYVNNDNNDYSHLTTLKPQNQLDLIMLSDTIAQTPQHFKNANAIGGQIHEIVSVLEACLQVERLERAQVIIRRIAAIGTLSPEAMVNIYNQYIKACLTKIIGYPNESATQALHKWFELEIVKASQPIHADTISYMLKASLQSPPGKRRDRLVRRYMDMIPGDEGLKVLNPLIMTAEELHDITLIAPTYNYPSGTTEIIQELAELEKEEQCDVMAGPEKKQIPEVKPTEQKGLGLKALKQSLSLFSNKGERFDPDKTTPAEQRERQVQLEEDAVRSAIDRWREENAYLSKMGFDTSLQTKSLGARMWKWHGSLTENLRAELAKIDEAEAREKKTSADMERCIYGPFLRYLPVEKLAAVTILTTMTIMSTNGVDRGTPLARAILGLGNSVEEESITEAIRRKNATTKSMETPTDLKRRMRGKKSRQQLMESLTKLINNPSKDQKAESSSWDPQWTAGIKAKIGSCLMGALIETAKTPTIRDHPVTGEQVTQIQPAFFHAYQYRLGRKMGVIMANPILINQMKREPVHSLLAKHLPMVVAPEPWTKFNQGGFILHPAKMMRVKLGDKDQRNYAEAAIAKGDMDQMFKGLDVLGKTSWRINQPVFDTMLEAWNSGEAIASIPPESPDLETPPEPEMSKDPTERRRWLRSVKNIENIRGGYHSQRCFQNFQLEIARALRDETFYFPHNVDFRGRAYPVPPYLNHMGADHARGLLKFGKGKELGVAGLKWLKVHLANVYGFDKASLSEREEFAVKNLEEVYDSVTNPLGGNRWWLKAEDPWQCLAACCELKNALDSPDPTRFVSHLPIHQDGTCNGLQHYAALGGDEWGAKQVNLEPGDRPADVYSAVADLVKESIDIDKKAGMAIAHYLDGKITRKVVKQTVMTNVYGVTYVGAKAQVKKQLTVAYPDMPNTTEINANVVSSYVATKIFKALSTMFRGAHDIQYWLGECANRISTALTAEQLDLIEQNMETAVKGKLKALTRREKTKTKCGESVKFSLDEHLQFKSSVIWTNPLRMPVVQPYRTSKARVITTNLQRISISEPHVSDPINKRKQLQGFPPNFVHSLDATHMILSALRCDELGLSFAAVHDSFWTHAADIEAMNNVLRDAFIRIHTEDVIGRLFAEFQARYKGGVFLAKIRPGTVLAERVMELRKNTPLAKGRNKDEGKAPTSIMTQKSIKVRELLDERLRLRLLQSSDPEEVEKGRKMLTVGSIFDELRADGDLGQSDDMSSVGLGAITGSSETTDLNPEDLETVLDEEIESESSDAGFSQPKERIGSFVKNLDPKNPPKKRAINWVYAWLPLRFPPVPKKVSSSSFFTTRFKPNVFREHSMYRGSKTASTSFRDSLYTKYPPRDF
jgi:DNA-directed RNA polymerase